MRIHALLAALPLALLPLPAAADPAAPATASEDSAAAGPKAAAGDSTTQAPVPGTPANPASSTPATQAAPATAAPATGSAAAKAAAPGAAQGAALLRKIDSANRVGDHFAFEMRVESFSKGKLKEQNQIVGFSYVDGKLDIRSLIHFTAPKTVTGRKMLIEDNYIWALFPKTRNLIRLTPLQILLGEVAYGDILRIVYGKDYDVTEVRETQVEGKPATALRLALKPERKGANYPSILLSVDAKQFRILQAEIFGSGGRLIKTAVFGDAAPFRGLKINRKIEIRDALKPDRYSVLQYLRMGEAEVPPAYFSKDLLSRARIYDF